MANGINALIPLSGRFHRGGADAFLSGRAIKEGREDRERQRELEDKAIKDAEAQAAEKARQMAEFESIVRGVKKLRPMIPQNIEGVPQFIGALDDRIAEIKSTGGNPSDTQEIRDLAVAGRFDDIRQQFDDVLELERQVQAQQLGVKAAPRGTPARTRTAGQPVVTRDAEGNVSFSVPVLSGEGDLSTATTPIQGEILSRTGETPGEQSQREVDTAGRTAAERGRVDRLNTAIDEGQRAADGLGSINRGIDLLSRVGTGRPEAVALEAKRLFGVESGDEGELSNLLGKAVLSQLRATFGAQFTVEEGKRLEDIEANFGKNNATNLRLLQNAREIAMRAAERGRRAAIEVGDDFTRQRIEEAMNFQLGGDDRNSEPAAETRRFVYDPATGTMTQK